MKLVKLFALMSVMALAITTTSCDDDDTIVVPEEQYGFSVEPATEMIFSYENETQTLPFTAMGKWHVELEEGCDWVYFAPSVGRKGKFELEVTVAQNTGDQPRATLFYLVSGEVKKMVTVRQPEFGGELKSIDQPVPTVIDPADIPDYDKYWPNSEHGRYALKVSGKFSFARYKSSEHFFVFWDTYFGDDPNGPTVPATQRVNVDDLLEKAEQFFNTNVNTLGLAVLGQGKSHLDNYKMQIYLLDPTPEDWVATGSGYDDVIGALWVTPATCHPVGSTIAHEIGHSFQYQVYCDKILQGHPDNGRHGFRYGFDNDGMAGCSYWEQCAQWQAHQDYPEEMFGYHLSVWKANCHRIFYHEWMRYASYWLQWDWVNRHGVGAYGAIWRESEFPEDPIETYTRIYNNDDMNKTYDELYEYAAHMVYYDIPGVKEYAIPEAKGDYYTSLYRNAAGGYQVGYASTPGTTGFNVIKLQPEEGVVSAQVTALAPGSALAAKDPGIQVNGDGAAVGTSTSYNSQANNSSNFRFGYVAIVNGQPVYSPMMKGDNASLSYTVPAGAQELYFVICATPDVYNHVAWDDKESNDEQWPYEVKFTGTDVYGYSEPESAVYEQVDANTLNVSYGVNINVNDVDWAAGNLVLMSNEVAGFIGVSATELNNITITPEVGVQVVPQDGRIVVYNREKDGTLNDMPTSNTGYWCNKDGNAVNWGNGHQMCYELTGINLTLLKAGAIGVDGETWNLRPTLVYTNGGVTKTINVTINFKFYDPTKASRPAKRVALSKMRKF